MRDFGKVSPAFWTGHTGREIRDRGHACQVIALYLLTCPSSTMSGLYYIPIATLAHETGTTIEGATKALQSLNSLLFSEYFEPLEVVWVVEMARYQLGETLSTEDRRHKGLIRSLQSYYRCPLLKKFWDKYELDFRLPLPCPYKPLDSPSKADVSKFESEIEIEKETKVNRVEVADSEPQTSLRIATGPKLNGESSGITKVFDHWLACRKIKHPRGPIPVLTKERREAIRERLREGYDIETLKLAVEGIWKTAFNIGQNDRGKEYTDIELALRDGPHIEDFADTALKLRELSKPREEQPSGTVPTVPIEAQTKLTEAG